MGRRPAAQQRLLSGCPDRRQVPRLHARRAVPHPINATMHADQRACAHSMSDFGEGHAGAKQLLTGHHAMSRTRQPGEFLIRCPALMSHYDT